MFRSFVLLAGLAGLLAVPAHAQPKRLERNVEKQREAVAAWTKCIAEENQSEVAALLSSDYRTKKYSRDLRALAQKRVAEECFYAMPRDYRKIQLGGLPFAGGLAERMIERDDEPLLSRLSMAAIGPAGKTFSYTDQVAMCVTRGAPHLVAFVFDSEVNSDAETKAIADLKPVISICTANGSAVEASPLAMRSMLATASYRLLAAQKVEDDA